MSKQNDTNSPHLHDSLTEAVGDLQRRFPGAPFLTLGQTVLWDEPVKAAFCRALEVLAPQATIVAGVHDTDYFAKLAQFEGQPENSDFSFAMLAHNDGDTRGLWSAAGEISCLFGSETVPTRHKLLENGVAFERVARDYPGGGDALLNEQTNAWGWRALVHTETRPLLAGEVLLADIAPALLEQLHWAFDESLRFIDVAGKPDEADANCPCAMPCSAREVAARILKWVEEYIAREGEATLSDLYRDLTPRLWAMVRGEGSCSLQTSHSLKLFRFNEETAAYPRFEFLNLFLDPQTRELAKTSYDDAVRGSGIYTLEQFGPGALPFDVVIPGKGRGTLRLHNRKILIDTEPPIEVCNDCDPGSVAALARVLQKRFGPDVVVVGKAVTLISMLARELVFVFHEKASSYTRLTEKMNASLREHGVLLELHPLLRLEYSTWDALENVETQFNLPPHLAAAFGSERVLASQFAARWEEVCREQDEKRATLKACRSPRELMLFLAKENSQWRENANEYLAARDIISQISHRAKELQAQASTLRAQAKAATQIAVQTEREKGEDFRARVWPLRERIRDINETADARLNPQDENGAPLKRSKAERREIAEQEKSEAEKIAAHQEQFAQLQSERIHYDQKIESARQKAKDAHEEARVLIVSRVEMENSAAAEAARKLIREMEYQAELTRLRAVRDALLVSEGLRYTNLRPTAWWLPMVSPDGKWFEKLVQTTKARIEEL